MQTSSTADLFIRATANLTNRLVAQSRNNAGPNRLPMLRGKVTVDIRVLHVLSLIKFQTELRLLQ